MIKNQETIQIHSSEGSRPQVSEDTLSPLVDIYQEKEGTTFLLAEVPGATLDSVDIRVDKGVLTISAGQEPPAMDEKYALSYRGFTTGRYFRAFALSDEIDRDKITASLADGVLAVKLPRAAAAQTRKIEVKTA